jgi:hypothetical protein
MHLGRLNGITKASPVIWSAFGSHMTGTPSFILGTDTIQNLPRMIPAEHQPTKPNKTDAGLMGIYRVIDASRSPSPHPSRSPNQPRHSWN